MYQINSQVEIYNHSESACNGQRGVIEAIQLAYDGYTRYYSVRLEDSHMLCSCIDDELMEG